MENGGKYPKSALVVRRRNLIVPLPLVLFEVYTRFPAKKDAIRVLAVLFGHSFQERPFKLNIFLLPLLLQSLLNGVRSNFLG